MRRDAARSGILRDEDGSSTIEFILWVPIFVLILGLVVDICFFFLAQSRMYDVAADATRCWAVVACTQAEAEAQVIADAEFNGAIPTAVGSTGGGAVTMTVTMSPKDISIMVVVAWLAGDKMTATVTQIQEGF